MIPATIIYCTHFFLENTTSSTTCMYVDKKCVFFITARSLFLIKIIKHYFSFQFKNNLQYIVRLTKITYKSNRRLRDTRLELPFLSKHDGWGWKQSIDDPTDKLTDGLACRIVLGDSFQLKKSPQVVIDWWMSSINSRTYKQIDPLSAF